VAAATPTSCSAERGIGKSQAGCATQRDLAPPGRGCG
jgi:hypothetical protein